MPPLPAPYLVLLHGQALRTVKGGRVVGCNCTWFERCLAWCATNFLFLILDGGILISIPPKRSSMIKEGSIIHIMVNAEFSPYRDIFALLGCCSSLCILVACISQGNAAAVNDKTLQHCSSKTPSTIISSQRDYSNEDQQSMTQLRN